MTSTTSTAPTASSPAEELPTAFDHLIAMSDDVGTFEHALISDPRSDHGYCVDDMARVLVVACREPEPGPALTSLAHTALQFLADAQGMAGDTRNRRAPDGRWEGPRTVEDCWGRSLWGLGTSARRGPDPMLREAAAAAFTRGAHLRSPWPRAMAFAALGASEVLAVDPFHHGARELLVAAVTAIGRPRADADWPWPEPRLTYANAVLPEALIAAGAALHRPDVVDDGLTLLGWLLERETLHGHLSPTPAAGSGPGDRAPGFDQQPIEVAAMADACARATTVSPDPRWPAGVAMAIAWFTGDNDAGAVMWDPVSGGGYDGLHPDAPNRNQGAESTLALISTFQHARAADAVTTAARP